MTTIRRRITKHSHFDFLTPIQTMEGWFYFGYYYKVWINDCLKYITKVKPKDI